MLSGVVAPDGFRVDASGLFGRSSIVHHNNDPFN